MPNPERRYAFADSGRIGFVYVLTNRAMPGVVKIGCTRKHPLQRAKELCASSGVPEPFALAYYRDFGDCFLAETMAHDHFADQRVNDQREFFEVSVSEAAAFLDGLVNSSRYRELESQGIVGGDYTVPVELPPLRFAELFVTFDPNGPDELTPEEQAKCRALEATL